MTEQDYIRKVVAERLRQQLNPNARPLIDTDAVDAVPEGGRLEIPPGAIITPLARSRAMERRVELVMDVVPAAPEAGVVALGADHGGYPMKEMLKVHLQARYVVVDCGTNSSASVDYPDFALAVAQMVSSGRAWRGIVVDGAGIGSCMVANKVPGVRAALCYDQASASNSREHNDANVLTLGAGLIGESLAKQIADTWLATDFGGGRHARRVNKIMDIERKYRG